MGAGVNFWPWSPPLLLERPGRLRLQPGLWDARCQPAPRPRAQGLAAIAVAIIPERSGQLLRQALQDRFERFGVGVERRYSLNASFGVSDDAIGIEADSSVTRIRAVGFAAIHLAQPGRVTPHADQRLGAGGRRL